MRRLIAFLRSGCWHVWEILCREDRVTERGCLPYDYAYHLQCKKCGDVTRRGL